MVYLGVQQPIAKKIAAAVGSENYNLLQNNGHIAHQEVDHVSFLIPRAQYTRVDLIMNVTTVIELDKDDQLTNRKLTGSFSHRELGPFARLFVLCSALLPSNPLYVVTPIHHHSI
jgi:hypothetical protein